MIARTFVDSNIFDLCALRGRQFEITDTASHRDVELIEYLGAQQSCSGLPELRQPRPPPSNKGKGSGW